MTTASNPIRPEFSVINLMHEIQESIARIEAVCSVLSIADSAIGLQQGEAWRLAQVIESEVGDIKGCINSYFDANKWPEKID
jgi:hypothetical protein